MLQFIHDGFNISTQHEQHRSASSQHTPAAQQAEVIQLKLLTMMLFTDKGTTRLDALKLLVTNIDVNLALSKACENGLLELCMKLMLIIPDLQVDASDGGQNDAISGTSREGRVKTVKLLLTVERVDPSACTNQAIRLLASRFGHTKIVKLLMADGCTRRSKCFKKPHNTLRK